MGQLPDGVAPETSSATAATTATLPGGCRRIAFPRFGDMRGDITVAELETDLPFLPKRLFFVYNVPNDRVRGEHAHRECSQVLLCIHGTVSIVVDDGREHKEVVLKEPSTGLYIPPKIWAVQTRFSQNAILAVFASDVYRAEDYIRDYAEFQRLVKATASEL